VLAVEPERGLARRLDEAARRNRAKAVLVVEQSLVRRRQADRDEDTAAEPETEATVPATVDELVAEAGWDGTELVKLDLDGAEPEALPGMARMLRGRSAPPVVVAVNGSRLRACGHTPAALLDALRRSGHATFLIEPDTPGRLRPLAAGDLLPAAAADVVALKTIRPLPSGWKYSGPMTDDEVMERILRVCVDSRPEHREQGAWLLREASAGLAAQRAMRVVAGALRDDPDPGVRAIASEI
jgi:FkbM family methyltransferase